MPTRNPKNLLMLVIALASSNCGMGRYVPEFIARSPDGQKGVRVMRDLPGSSAEYFFRVEVSAAGQTNVIYEHGRRAAIGLVEAHWSADSGQVGLLICNMFNGPVLLSYDLAQHRLLPPSTFRPMLEEQIKLKYSLRSTEDAFHWACSNAGLAAYHKQK